MIVPENWLLVKVSFRRNGSHNEQLELFCMITINLWLVLKVNQGIIIPFLDCIFILYII